VGLLRRHTSVCGRKSFATYGYFDFTCGAYFTLHDEHAEAEEGVARDDAAYPESKEECKDRTEENRASQGDGIRMDFSAMRGLRLSWKKVRANLANKALDLIITLIKTRPPLQGTGFYTHTII
jgi:hypothetical protein|tara:strand:+ start:12510 stop:12878 length:369 start_codon:yes stop_codon:yes gene_type:complete